MVMPYKPDDPRRRLRPWDSPFLKQPVKRPKGYREPQCTIPLNKTAKKALDDLRLALSVQVLCDDNALSRSGLILLLVELFKAGKIQIDDVWCRLKLLDFPRRGRPRVDHNLSAEMWRSLEDDGDRKKQPW